MLNDKSTRNIFKILAQTFLFLFIVSFAYTGCGDDEITSGPPVVDTTALVFNDLIISERIPPFDSAFSSIDLYHGVIVQEQSTIKDAVLVDIQGIEFYFRSGDQSIDVPPGFQTRFKDVYSNLSQSEFDTVSVILDTDSLLTPDDFTSDQTGNFIVPLTSNNVFGFYLAGRYPTYSPNRVYGMIYLDSAWRDGIYAKVKVDIKINKNGENRFAKTTSITF